jgi:general secretion pathway protein I
MRTRAERGFTLIEVLAALAIVAIGMLGVIKGVNEAVRNSSYLRDKTLAHWLAMNRLAEVRLAARIPEVAKTNGDAEFAGQRWRWRMEVTQTPVQSMRRIDISVRKDGMPEKTSLATVTGFYGSAVERPGVASTNQLYSLAPGADPGPDGAGPESSADERRSPDNDVPDTPTAPVPEPEPGIRDEE